MVPVAPSQREGSLTILLSEQISSGAHERLVGCLGSDALLVQLTGLMEAKPTLISESQAPSALAGGWLSNQPTVGASTSCKTYRHTPVQSRQCARAHTNTHTHTPLYIHMNTHIHAHIIYTQINMCTDEYTHTHMYTHACTHIDTHMHTRIHFQGETAFRNRVAAIYD